MKLKDIEKKSFSADEINSLAVTSFITNLKFKGKLNGVLSSYYLLPEDPLNEHLYLFNGISSIEDIMLSSSYSQIGSSFSTLAGFDYLTYLYWKRKSDKFDEIEGATSGLFSGSATSRSYCVKDPSRPNSKGLSTDVNNTLATDSMKGKMAKTVNIF